MSAMAKAQKNKAEAFEASAEKLLAKGKKAWFNSSRERNQEEAAETLLQAANAYKVGGLNHEAGTTYMRVGKLYQDLNAGNSGASGTNDAAKAYTQAVE